MGLRGLTDAELDCWTFCLELLEHRPAIYVQWIGDVFAQRFIELGMLGVHEGRMHLQSVYPLHLENLHDYQNAS